ncbi:MAG: DUF4292 domain-containing protein [Muribaculaceae bacterium]|nr:DUF4292 domain-containing protein [Muribaculaceae bacterium]
MKKIIYNIILGVTLLANQSAEAQYILPQPAGNEEEEFVSIIDSALPETVCDSVYTMPVAVRELPEGYMNLDTETAVHLTENIVASYPDWETVELNGKLRMEGLPLTPNVRIYMERNRSVSISIRAPFVGEVGRLEANADSVSAINKMNRTYSTYAVSDSPVPVDVSTLQCLLLGRINIPDYGQFGTETASLVDMYVTDNFQQILILPKQEAEIEGCSYGFVTDGEGMLADVIVTIDSAVDDSVTVEYNRDNDSTDIDILAAIGERIYNAQLELKAPKWNAGDLAPVVLGPKYRRLSFKDFLKAF